MQSQKDTVLFSPIGHLRSVFNHKFGTPRQGALAPHSLAIFELVPRWQQKGIFDELAGFSHVWLISHFHLSQNARTPSKIHPPRLGGRAVGVLASRSPHRPNNLGLTLAKLDRVEGDQLWLSGIDLIDGTPILDIKPYLGEADRPATFTQGWTEQAEVTNARCSFATTAEQDLDQLVKSGKIGDRRKFVMLVGEVLALDPRPLSYRSRENERFAIVLDGVDVHARYDQGGFTVESLQLFEAKNLEAPRH